MNGVISLLENLLCPLQDSVLSFQLRNFLPFLLVHGAFAPQFCHQTFKLRGTKNKINIIDVIEGLVSKHMLFIGLTHYKINNSSICLDFAKECETLAASSLMPQRKHLAAKHVSVVNSSPLTSIWHSHLERKCNLVFRLICLLTSMFTVKERSSHTRRNS